MVQLLLSAAEVFLNSLSENADYAEDAKLLKSIDIVPTGGRAGGVSFFFSHPQNNPIVRAKNNKWLMIFSSK